MDDSIYFRDKAKECRALAGFAMPPLVVDGLLRMAREFELLAIKADIRALSADRPSLPTS